MLHLKSCINVTLLSLSPLLHHRIKDTTIPGTRFNKRFVDIIRYTNRYRLLKHHRKRYKEYSDDTTLRTITTPVMTPNDDLQHLPSVKTEPVSPTLSVASVSDISSSSSTQEILGTAKLHKQKMYGSTYRATDVLRDHSDADDLDAECIIERLRGEVGYAQKGILETKQWFDRVAIDDLLDAPQPEDVTFMTPSLSPKTKLSEIPEVAAAHALMSVWGGVQATTPISPRHTASDSDEEMGHKSDGSRSSTKSLEPNIRDSPVPQGKCDIDMLLNAATSLQEGSVKVTAIPSSQGIYDENVLQQSAQNVELKWRIEEEEIFRNQPKVELPTPKLSTDSFPKLINSPDIRRGIYTGPVHEMCPILGCRAVFCSADLLKEAVQHTLTTHAGSGQLVAPQKLYSFHRGVFLCIFTEHVECGVQFKELQEVLDHLKEDHGLVFCDYRCVVCSMRFNHETMLKRHGAMTHNQTWWN